MSSPTSPAGLPLLRTSTEHPWRRFLRYGSIASGIGVLVVLIVGLGDPSLYRPREFLGGALVGFAIGSGALIAELAALTITPRVGLVWAQSLRIAAYFVGGAVGRVVAVAVVATATSSPSWEADLKDPYHFVFFGGFAVFIGLVFQAFERLSRRLRESNAQLEAKSTAEEELRTARSIQQRLLAPAFWRGPGYELAARNVPATVVAGDFYDYFDLEDGVVGIAVADVAGKGMGASVIMSTVKAMLPLMAAQRSASQTLRELNRRLCADLAPREFVAMLFARLDPTGGLVEIANAGLPDPYLVRGGERRRRPSVIEVPGPRLPLGVRPELDYDSLELRLEVGDRLLVYTDGLVEVPVGDELLGYERLAEMVVGEQPSVNDWLDNLLQAVAALSGPDFEDDRTLLAVERLETEAGRPTP